MSIVLAAITFSLICLIFIIISRYNSAYEFTEFDHYISFDTIVKMYNDTKSWKYSRNGNKGSIRSMDVDEVNRLELYDNKVHLGSIFFKVKFKSFIKYYFWIRVKLFKHRLEQNKKTKPAELKYDRLNQIRKPHIKLNETS